jgi:hypothetical protein
LRNSGTITAGVVIKNSEVIGDITNEVGGEILDGIAFDRSSFGEDLINAGLITRVLYGEGYDKNTGHDID